MLYSWLTNFWTKRFLSLCIFTLCFLRKDVLYSTWSILNLLRRTSGPSSFLTRTESPTLSLSHGVSGLLTVGSLHSRCILALMENSIVRPLLGRFTFPPPQLFPGAFHPPWRARSRGRVPKRSGTLQPRRKPKDLGAHHMPSARPSFLDLNQRPRFCSLKV